MYSTWRVFCGSLTLAASLATLGCGSGGNTFVRAVNASPGLAGFTVQVGTTRIASSFPYGTVSVQPPGQFATNDHSGNYRAVAAGANQTVSVYLRQGDVLASEKQTFLTNAYSTIVTLSPAPGIHLLTLADDNSPPTGGNFKLRFVQASSAANAVDVYLVPPRTNIGTATPILSNFLFGQATSPYLEVAPRTYELEITPHGNPATVLINVVFSPAAGKIYTAFPLDPAPGSSNFGLLVTVDPVVTASAKSSGTM